MTRLKRFLKSSARAARCSFYLCVLVCAGCSSSTTPTYSVENIERSVETICEQEYNFKVVARLVGSTLWVYLPVSGLFSALEKPEEYKDKFIVRQDNNKFEGGLLKLDYAITPFEEKKEQSYKYNREAIERMNKVLKVINRVVFSMDRSRRQPLFYCLVTADTEIGYEVKEVIHNLDLKKVSYGFISFDEFQHRTVTDSESSEEIKGDEAGEHLEYRDISLEEFLAEQIAHRISLKFGKPEVEPGADIDKEIEKIVSYTLQLYNYKDFSGVELNNQYTNTKRLINPMALFEGRAR